jgi:hypothetical protein
MSESEDLLENLDLAGALTVESVQQWRAEVESFFAEEWWRLREIIREMEESEWDAELLPSVNTSTEDHPALPNRERGALGSTSEHAGPRSCPEKPAEPLDASSSSSLTPEVRLRELSRSLHRELTVRQVNGQSASPKTPAIDPMMDEQTP